MWPWANSRHLQSRLDYFNKPHGCPSAAFKYQACNRGPDITPVNGKATTLEHCSPSKASSLVARKIMFSLAVCRVTYNKRIHRGSCLEHLEP